MVASLNLLYKISISTAHTSCKQFTCSGTRNAKTDNASHALELPPSSLDYSLFHATSSCVGACSGIYGQMVLKCCRIGEEHDRGAEAGKEVVATVGNSAWDPFRAAPGVELSTIMTNHWTVSSPWIRHYKDRPSHEVFPSRVLGEVFHTTI